MRIRQVKPDYWRDARLADLSDTDRLVYIGLWMVADDAGWFRSDLPEIATDLYPYLARHVRERRVGTAMEHLSDVGRIVAFECGHAHIPTMTRHQRLASPEKQVRTTAREHERCIPADTRGDPRDPANPRVSPERNGTVREGKERGGVGGEGGPQGPRFKVVNGRLAMEELT